MSVVQDEFLRRYATSPIHVPRLERLVAAYGGRDGQDQFARTYIEWDRASHDPEGARIVTEILPQLVDEHGDIVPLTSDAIQGAIGWLSNRGTMPLSERSHVLRTILCEAVEASRRSD
jgi:hypothetical protein